LVNDSITGIDNQTIDAGRILWIIGVLVFIGLTCYVVICRNAPWEMTNYGIAFGAALAAGAGALALKAKTEPKGGGNGTP